MALGFALGSSGCFVVPVSATNPIPGMTTVAVAPFMNVSNEPTVDGRRFATAYFTELQKLPSFQVIPVGIVERAIEENNLAMANPADVIALAKILDADAVVVGAVTDYSAYYPPQIGLQVSWFSPANWTFFPGVPPRPLVQVSPTEASPDAYPESATPGMKQPAIVRAQSADDFVEARLDGFHGPGAKASVPIQLVQSGKAGQVWRPPDNWPTRNRADAAADHHRSQKAHRHMHRASDEEAASECEPPQPVMSYTRFFDGADPQVVKSLKHYVAYRGDMRSGNWEAHLHRSDDFIRFVSRQMILEMLAVHGGALKTEFVFPFWK